MPILLSMRFKVIWHIIIMMLAAGVFCETAFAQSPDHTGREKLETVTVVSDDTRHRFQVELARTPKQQRKGLMHRDQLEKDRGMLFVFDNSRIRSFWMKNTHIALDMLFIDKSGEIRHIHHNATPNSREQISSQAPVRAVLEINGGIARKSGIEKGDMVHHAIFGNALAP